MQIEKIELENIKPFKKQTFTFSNGINVLSGPNGSGKSTVFEAIGYALFGVHANQFVGSSERFVRKGQKRGRVRIHFTTSDGQRYLSERWAGINAKWLLAKKRPDEGLEALELKDEEVRLMIKKLLNLRGEQPIDEQFLNVIGPLQNDFLGPFTKKGKQRTDEFDRILGIDSWREAFRRSREIENEAEHIIQLKEKLIADKTLQVEGYDDVVERLKSVEQRRSQASESLAQTTEQLAHVSKQAEEMAKLNQALRDWQEAMHKKNQELAGLQAAEGETRRSLSDAYAAKAICDRSQGGYQACKQAEQQLAELKEKQRLALSLEKEIHNVDKQIAAMRTEIDTIEKNLQEREQQAQVKRERVGQELAEAEESADEYNLAHERAVHSFKAYEQFALDIERIERPSNIGERILRSIADLAAATSDARSLKQRLEAKPAIESTARREKELAAECTRATEGLLSVQARRRQLEEGSIKLAGGICPFFEEKCLNLERKAVAPTNFFSQQIDGLQRKETEMGRQLEQMRADFTTAQKAAKELIVLNEVESQLQKVSERVQRARMQLDLHLAPLLPGGSLWEGIRNWAQAAPTLPYREELMRHLNGTFDFQPTENLPALKTDVVALIERYNDLIAKLKRVASNRRTDLDNAVRKISADLAAAHQSTDELRKAQRQLEEEFRSIARGRAELDGKRHRLAAKIQEGEAKKTKALEYKDLEAEIKTQEEIQAANKEHYLQFLSHQAVAHRVDELERRNAALRDQIAQLDREIAELTQRLDVLKSSYDEAAHNEVQKQAQALERARGSLSAELKGLYAEITQLQAKQAQMEGLFKEISELNAEVKAYKKTLSFVKDLRSRVLNEVSEKLSQRFREEIGQNADRIYRVIARSDEELRWGEGYSIMLVDLQDGQERVRYDEELSGGQMMSAVVALRLALLQTSGSRMGFFDEPTSNLDDARRANLAQAFRSLDEGRGLARQTWYEQLFLISHDVTFTEITDQTIHFLDRGVVLAEA